MTVVPRLLLDSLGVDAGPTIRVRVPEGAWVAVPHSDPDTFVRGVAGLTPAVGGVLLDGRELAGLPAAARTAEGLGSVLGRLPDLPTMRVADVLLLARPVAGPVRSWRTALGLGYGADLADQAAAARALAGRAGLARWVSRPAVGLPMVVQALADAVRAMAASPGALVWRRPEWLVADDAETVRAVVQEHQQQQRFSVVEVMSDT